MKARSRLAVPRPGRRGGIMLGASVALLLHAGLVWLLLPHATGRPGMDPLPEFEVELVDQAPKVKGAPQASAAPPASAPPTPPIPALPPDPAGDQPVPPPPAQRRADQPAPPVQAPRPKPGSALSSVNLDGQNEDLEGLVVSGPHVVPARPDALFHNKPPGYPADAVRRHAEGRVMLLVHVTETGTPGWVDVTESSGDASLDRAAKEAVALWRFLPAREHGVAIPVDVPFSFSFSIDRPGASGPARATP